MTETSTELEVRRPAPIAPNVDRELTDSWVDVIRPITILAQQICETDFVPRDLRGNAPAVAAVILYGREVGLPPMTALSHVYIVEGKPGLSAKGLRARVLAAGHEFEVTESTGSLCTVRGRRRGAEKWHEVTWTMDMARAAKLDQKNTYKNYPRRMLQARASSELCDLVFPDVVAGMGAAEVLDDEREAEAPVEGPKTTVSRARRTPPTTPAQTGQSPKGPSDSAPPPPAAAEIPLPPPAAPSGPAGTPSPGPEVGDPRDQERELPEDLVEAAAQAPERETPAEVKVLPAGPAAITAAQSRMLHGRLGSLHVKDDDRHDVIEALIGHVLEPRSAKSLTKVEATKLIDDLGPLKTIEDLDALVQERVAAMETRQ